MAIPYDAQTIETEAGVKFLLAELAESEALLHQEVANMEAASSKLERRRKRAEHLRRAITELEAYERTSEAEGGL